MLEEQHAVLSQLIDGGRRTCRRPEAILSAVLPNGALFPNADLPYRLRSLPIAAAALHVGAHPDDEETGMVAYLSRGLGVRTVYWSATRGEGGQNRIGPDRGEALGLVRTWESLDARQVDGGEVLYGPFYDFGFSKSGKAALAKWGEEDLTREIVRAIRLVQPQVVISRWSGAPSDGHGHHQAVGMVVPAAFEAAGDPDRFPDLRAEGVVPWRPQKLYCSLARDWQPGEDAVFGQIVPEFEREGFLRIDTGAVDPIAGRTFQEQAAIAINLHRTQGMAFVPDRDEYFLYYRPDRTLVPVPDRESSFFDGLDCGLTWLSSYAVEGAASLRTSLEHAAESARRAVEAFRPEEPQLATEFVLAGLEALSRARAGLDVEADELRTALDRFLARKVRDFEHTAASCLGLVVECLVPKHRVARGSKTPVTVRFWTKPARGLGRVTLSLEVPADWQSRALDAPSSRGVDHIEASFEVEIPPSARFSTPYWLREARKPYRYCWPDGDECALPFEPPVLQARADVEIDGQKLALTAPAVSRESFPGGFRELRLAVVPRIALTPRESRIFLPATSDAQRVHLQVLARCMQEGGASGELSLGAPPGWKVTPPSARLAFSSADQSQTVEFELDVPGSHPVGIYDLRYEISATDDRYSVSLQPVWQGAPGVPKPADETTCVAEALLATPARASVHVLDTAFVPSLSYGYVHGVEEDIVRSLERFGLDVTLLTSDDLAYRDLGSFDEIVVGPNAYLVRDDLRQNASRLLEYVEHGGTLIVQYQGYDYQAGAFAPFPFKYRQPHDRVTFPDAPVTILEPEHPLLCLPNEITTLDFDGWVHDRGLYFFGEWDEHYVPVLECHDPGEDEKRGGLLVAGYGRGMYVYAAYSFFRQIPAGVQGAIQLFANLLGLAEGRIRERIESARNIDLFSFMSDEQLRDIVRLMSERWFEDGAMLAHEGEPSRELFLIVEGEVEVLKEGKSKKPLWVARPGEAVGELGVLVEVPRTASLRARGHVKTLTMGGNHLWRLLEDNRDLAEGVIRFLATKIAGQP
jgi:LmbE family N-acetylglucosaminyl deacetylase